MKDSDKPVRRQPKVAEMVRLYSRHLIEISLMLDALNLKFRSAGNDRELEIKDLRKGGKYYEDFHLGRLDAAMEIYRANVDRGRNLHYYMSELTPEIMAKAAAQVQAENTHTVIQKLTYDEHFAADHETERDNKTLH